MKKITLILIAFLIFISLSAVSASENLTDPSFGDDPSMLESIESVDDVVLSEETDSIENGSIAQPSTIAASDVVGYSNFSTKVNVTLKSNNTPLAYKALNITINGVSYNRTTDVNGEAIVSVKLPTGKYTADFSFAGDENSTYANGSCKITIKDAIKTKIKVADKYINYRQGLKNAFIVLLVDGNGKPIKNQNVTVKVDGKVYTTKTDKKGYAEVFLDLKKGKYKVKFSFAKSSPYLSSKGSFKIKVKGPIAAGAGYWIWSAHMKSVNLKKLSKLGTKHLFLHSNSIYLYGTSSVVNWIAKAHKYGMEVHIWMQICYSNGKWVRPCNPDDSINYGFLKSKIKEAKKYANIKGVDGVHFDYVRFGGTAHLYDSSTDAINYFVKKASVKIHKDHPNCIVSAAVMPEPKMMIYWYGQDIPTMGKYLDVIVPMVYKGNFNKDRGWITKIVKLYNKESKSAVIWAGLQTYYSESNTKKLSHKQLTKDARAAKAGGATGSILFRYGLTKFLNFKKV